MKVSNSDGMLFNLDDYGTKDDEWKTHWKDMPEFIQEDNKPIQQITVSFSSYDDVKKFAELLGMNVSRRTDSTWFPHRPLEKYRVGYGK